MELEGRHVFITGAGKRLGRAIAERLLDFDIRLTGHYRTAGPEIASLGEEANRRGRSFHPVKADLEKVETLRAAVGEATRRFGPVDVLVNSASDFYPTPALDCSEADWDHFMSTNLKGQFFLSQACAKGMQAKGGVIINLGDVNGEKPMRGFTPYVCSKAGLLMLTRNLAKEWAPSIRVNSVSPGPVLLPESYTAEQRQRSADRTLLRRLGSAGDIAEATLFLIRNDYMTGFDLKVDGGRILS